MVLLQRKLYFLKEPERGPTYFKGWGPTYSSGGVQMIISIETNNTCEFPGEGVVATPYPPLDSRMISYQYINVPILFEAL